MASTESVVCIGQRSACAVRFTRLDTDCSPLAGDNNAVVTAALVTMTATPEVEEGTKFEPKNACGDICWTAEDDDRIKRYTIELELCTHDAALIEIATDSRVVLGASTSPWSGKIMGVETPGPQTVHGNGVALEIWAKTASGTGPCGTAGDLPPYVLHIFPRAMLRPGDHTFANDVATLKLSGWATNNPSWLYGPWYDWEAATPMGVDTPYAWYYAESLPDTGCGYQSVPTVVSS